MLRNLLRGRYCAAKLCRQHIYNIRHVEGFGTLSRSGLGSSGLFGNAAVDWRAGEEWRPLETVLTELPLAGWLSAALEQRNDCIRRAAWRLQEEYAAEDVQREILALRQLYPYQQKKSILALEMEGEKRRMQEDAEKEPDDVQRYVEAAQALKQQGCEDAHAEAPTMDEGLAPVPDGHQGHPERVSEEGNPQKDDAKGRTVEEELRFHCRAGLAAVQRQVAQHCYEDGSKPEGSTLALLPQNHPSALAGALAMCAEDAIASAMAGAREAHLAQLRKQEKILSHALQPLEQSEDGDEVDAGDANRFNSALQNLPAVKAARDRAMRALGLPESLAPTAARMTELLHDTDRTARAANMLSMKRLRLIASPHPSINGQAAEALRSRGVLMGNPATWFFGMEGIQHQFPAVLEELSKAANAGVFNHWFGGPRAGRYAVVTGEDSSSQRPVIF
ncbi:unnamed protein product [Symbiodinium microadriaticum]|nr:unnamed protein product [Symbiodinium microadriaticum]